MYGAARKINRTLKVTLTWHRINFRPAEKFEWTPRRSNLPSKGLDGCGVYIMLAASYPGAS